jgi:oligopeptide/dipeptide ABC transporter ATP-binding protein
MNGPSALTDAAKPREPLLDVRDLTVAFAGRRSTVHAVNGVSFDLAPGEALGVVGESGSGKSVSVAALLGLLGPTARVTSGSARFEGRDLLELSPRELRAVRGRRIGIVFQDPLNSLNPVLKVGVQIEEILKTHGTADAAARLDRILELLNLVGISDPKRTAAAYPHQLSGGMRQRAMIAIAIACQPALLIADEPTTALDVTTQAQILEHFRSLRDRFGMALLLITHDLGIVAGTTDRVAVMYAGRVVETGPTDRILANPLHPYTQGLLKSLPRLDRPRIGQLHSIEGSPPDPSRPTTGCSFRPRCPKRVARCEKAPALVLSGPGRAVACWVALSEGSGVQKAPPS